LTFTVITTDPNEVVQPLHDRMPVIIPERDYDRWLKADPDRPPIDLLRPFDAGKMTAWKVEKAVGNVKNDSPELIEPASDAAKEVKEDREKVQPGGPQSALWDLAYRQALHRLDETCDLCVFNQSPTPRAGLWGRAHL
jgi:hypothetical protein